MKSKTLRVFLLAVCMMLAAAPLAAAESAEQNNGVLGIGIASFWPFLHEEDVEQLGAFVCPYGMDAFVFYFFEPNVEAGEGTMEIRLAEDDSVVGIIEADDFVLSTVTGDLLGTGEDIPYTEMVVRTKKPLETPGKVYLHIPAGMFVLSGVQSNEYGDPSTLFAVLADCGFASSDYRRELSVGETETIPMKVGTAAYAVITCTGAITGSTDKLTADGDVIITAAEIGEGQISAEFYDAEGNMITSGYDVINCK